MSRYVGGSQREKFECLGAFEKQFLKFDRKPFRMWTEITKSGKHHSDHQISLCGDFPGFFFSLSGLTVTSSQSLDYCRSSRCRSVWMERLLVGSTSHDVLDDPVETFELRPEYVSQYTEKYYLTLKHCRLLLSWLETHWYISKIGVLKLAYWLTLSQKGRPNSNNNRWEAQAMQVGLWETIKKVQRKCITEPRL